MKSPQSGSSTKSSKADDGSLDTASEQLVRRFEVRWKHAIDSNSAPPDLETFLSGAAVEQQPLVRSALVELQDQYFTQRQRLTDVDVNDVTRDDQHDDTRNVSSEGPQPSSDETIDFAPGKRSQQPTVVPNRPRLHSLPSVPGYELIGVLGRGGMGVVYCARQLGLNRLVALKMVLSGEHASEDRVARFRAEAEAVARVQHSNIVQIYDVGDVDGLPYFSLEYVDGPSLAAERRGRPLLPSKAAEMVETLAKAIQTAHRAGIVHRDLKPGNILLSPDNVPKITDFGLVKYLEAPQRKTETGNILGTPSYMAPEQATQGKDVGPTADIYSLGSILYYLLTGRPPFNGPTPLDTLFQLLNDEPLSPCDVQPQTPHDVETICLKCLEKNPAKRYQTAQELADDLRRFLRREPIRARRVGRIERAARWCKRNPKTAWPTFTAVALAISMILGGISFSAKIFQQNREIEKHVHVATEQNELAINTLRSLIYEVQDTLNDPEQRRYTVRRKLLTIAKKGLDEVVKKSEGYTQSPDVVVASAERKTGDLNSILGYHKDAERHYLNSLEMAEKLHAEGRLPDPDENFSRLHRLLGEVFREMSEWDQVRSHVRQQLIHQKKMLELYPDDKATIEHAMGFALGRLADAAEADGEVEEFVRLAQQGYELRKKALNSNPHDLKARTELAGSLGKIVNAHQKHCNLPLAERDAKQVLGDLLNILRDTPPPSSKPGQVNDLFRLKWNIALKRRVLADIHLFQGKFDSSLSDYQQCLNSLTKLAASMPATLRRPNDPSGTIKRHIAGMHHRIGTTLLRKQQANSARTHFEKSLAIRRELSSGRRMNRRSLTALMIALARNGRHDEAFKVADRLLKPRTKRNPRTKKDETIGPANATLIEVAACYSLCSESGQGEKVKEWQDKAMTYIERAIQSKPEFVIPGVKKYSDRARLKYDPDLMAVRKSPRFEEAIGTIAKVGNEKKR